MEEKEPANETQRRGPWGKKKNSITTWKPKEERCQKGGTVICVGAAERLGKMMSTEFVATKAGSDVDKCNFVWMVGLDYNEKKLKNMSKLILNEEGWNSECRLSKWRQYVETVVSRALGGGKLGIRGFWSTDTKL